MTTTLRWLLAFLSAIWLMALGAPSVWLLIMAVTWRGRLIALTGFAAATLPILLSLRVGRDAFGRVRNGGATIIVVGLALIMLLAPNGSPSESAIRNRYLGGERFHRLTVTNLVPEPEQLLAGLAIAPFADPYIDLGEAARYQGLIRTIYRDVEIDPAFRAVGSAMGYGYSDVLGGHAMAGHYYLYVPRNASNSPMPALVFLHGSGGNFKAYTWLLSRIAEERGMVIITPTFGFGNWRQPGGRETIFRVLDDASQIVDIDAGHIYLAGLSNGGLGVSLAASEQPQRFRGLIFLSPVFATEITDGAAFADAWKGRPVMVITGAADDRIPVSYVETRIARFMAKGIDVTSHIYPGEDHFLIFARRDEVIEDISKWLDQH